MHDKDPAGCLTGEQCLSPSGLRTKVFARRTSPRLVYVTFKRSMGAKL
jgi:hypothetical protein